jgi:hypothetical protein
MTSDRAVFFSQGNPPKELKAQGTKFQLLMIKVHIPKGEHGFYIIMSTTVRKENL